jgi:hypothetical protein
MELHSKNPDHSSSSSSSYSYSSYSYNKVIPARPAWIIENNKMNIQPQYTEVLTCTPIYQILFTCSTFAPEYNMYTFKDIDDAIMAISMQFESGTFTITSYINIFNPKDELIWYMQHAHVGDSPQPMQHFYGCAICPHRTCNNKHRLGYLAISNDNIQNCVGTFHQPHTPNLEYPEMWIRRVI